LGGIWGENSRKPVFGFRLSGGKGILQRSQSEFILGRRQVGGKRRGAWLWFLGLGVGKKCRTRRAGFAL
ncbi:TPA: hypothetical protein ACFOQS_002093, partial [Neisseria meningitidis]